GGLVGARKRAGQDAVPAATREKPARACGLQPSRLIEWDIRAALNAPLTIPVGFAVPNEVEKCHRCRPSRWWPWAAHAAAIVSSVNEPLDHRGEDLGGTRVQLNVGPRITLGGAAVHDHDGNASLRRTIEQSDARVDRERRAS